MFDDLDFLQICITAEEKGDGWGGTWAGFKFSLKARDVEDRDDPEQLGRARVRAHGVHGN
ncbi:MAG: hypothetical protein RLZZ184_3430, partial [Cyanobacteriota bacterium]